MNGDINQIHRPQPKPDSLITWCFGVVCGMGAIWLWVYSASDGAL